MFEGTKVQISKIALLVLVLVSMLIGQAALAEDVVKVTADNYVRAETDYQVKTYVEGLGCFGKFIHGRKPYDVDKRVTVRANRDTLYSFAVFDLTTPVRKLSRVALICSKAVRT
jgi:cytochrome c556